MGLCVHCQQPLSDASRSLILPRAARLQAPSAPQQACSKPLSHARRHPASGRGERQQDTLLQASFHELHDVSPIVAQSQPVLAPRTQDLAGDPFGLLLRQRIVFLGGEVNDFAADAVISQLLLLDSQDPNKDIKLFINSPGGSVTAGMGIYDAMQMCRSEVQTFCFGLAASMGAFLLGAGAKGKRSSMPNARIMIHQPLGGASGQAVDIEIQSREIMYHRLNINRIMAGYCSQPIEKIEEDTDRDRYMSPLEAKNYGLIDSVIGGDQAGFDIKGSPKDFPRTKEAYVNWGDLEDDGSSGSRFRQPIEPFTKPLTDGKN